MQEMIDYLQEMLEDDFDSKTKYIQENCIKALEKEKKQIIDAVNNGTFKKGNQYYQETFTKLTP